MALKDCDMEVQGAYSHRDAIYMMEHEQVDLALVDVVMMDLFDRGVHHHGLAAFSRYPHDPLCPQWNQAVFRSRRSKW